MKGTFSFSEKPILFILNSIPSLLPGIEKAMAVSYEPEPDRLICSIIKKDQDGYCREVSKVNDTDRSLEQLRKDNSPYSWVRQEDISFEITTKAKVQLNIFNELDNNILILRTQNNHDNLSDLIFVFFNKNLSNFGVVNDDSFLSTENKVIIGHLLRNTVNVILSTLKEDRGIFIHLVENQQSVINEITALKRETFLARSMQKETIVHICRAYLEELGRLHSMGFELTESAVRKLQDFEGDPGLLRGVLERAARFAKSTKLDPVSESIIISDHHIILTTPAVKKETEKVLPEEDNLQIEVPARYARTFNFLNKLETAAQSVKVKNLLLTSANVGSEFPSPVTPAAITDALKNHQAKIIYLLRELPGRWQIIRSEFRPVQNILNPRQERQKRTG